MKTAELSVKFRIKFFKNVRKNIQEKDPAKQRSKNDRIERKEGTKALRGFNSQSLQTQSEKAEDLVAM